MENTPEMAVSLVLHAEHGEVEIGRHPRRTVKLKDYAVVAADGAIIGLVSLDMATLERKTPGRRYVNARWYSPRWFYRAGSVAARRSRPFETRKMAVQELLWEVKRPRS